MSATFFDAVTDLSVAVVETVTGGHVVRGAHAGSFSGFCTSGDPRRGAVCFVQNAAKLASDVSVVGAVICRPSDAERIPDGPVVIAADHPQHAFATLVAHLHPDCLGGVQTTGPWHKDAYCGAYVSETAMVEDGARIMPGAVVGAGCEIGSGAVIGANTVIGDGCKIGRNTSIAPGCVVQCALVGNGVSVHPGTMIGQDGFGYFPAPAGLAKMPHIGRVIIQDGVEIGANTTIDRGTIGDTVIGEGSKIDNLVQIAHNVQLGCYVILCGQVGISGSCTVGDGAMLGGNAGLANGLTIGAGANIAAAAGVMNDIPAGEKWAGAPAQPIRAFFKEQATLRKLAKGNKPA